MSFDLTNKNISDTFQNVLQKTGSDSSLYTLDGTQVGDLKIAGNLIAEQYIVSSSVTYLTQSFSSGSTNFGDSADDSHRFTGSISMSDDLYIAGGGIIYTSDGRIYENPTSGVSMQIGNLPTALNLNSADTASNGNYGGGWTGMVLTQSMVGVGTDTPSATLHVLGTISASGPVEFMTADANDNVVYSSTGSSNTDGTAVPDNRFAINVNRGDMSGLTEELTISGSISASGDLYIEGSASIDLFGDGNLITGTVTASNYSTIVTGVGTSFTTDFSVGDAIKVTSGSYSEGHIVDTIITDTNLLIGDTWRGNTFTGSFVYSFNPQPSPNLLTIRNFGDSTPVFRISSSGDITSSGHIYAGYNNILGSGFHSTLLAGTDNGLSSSTDSAIVAGQSNRISGSNRSYIGAGTTNKILSSGGDNTIAGGTSSQITGSADLCTIAGGTINKIYSSQTDTPESCIIAGGRGNAIKETMLGTIGGGLANLLESLGTTVLAWSQPGIFAGSYNEIRDIELPYGSVILGGVGNVITGSGTSGVDLTGSLGDNNMIGGGNGNIIRSSSRSSILGGTINHISGSDSSSIVGGAHNHTVGYHNVHIIGSNISASQADTTFTENIIAKGDISASGGILIGSSSIIEDNVDGGAVTLQIYNSNNDNGTDKTSELQFKHTIANGTKTSAGKIVAGKDNGYQDAARSDSFMSFYTALDATDTEYLRITSDGKISGSLVTTASFGRLTLADSGSALDFIGHISGSSLSTASAGHFKGDGSGLTGVTSTFDIDGLDALGGTGLHQTQDNFVFSDNGTEKKITFSNLEDAIFGNVSGDATVAAGGAITNAAAQTNINSILATDLVLGEDAQTQIDFEIVNEIHFDVNNAELVNMTGNKISGSLISTGSLGRLTLVDSGSALDFIGNMSGSILSTGSFGAVSIGERLVGHNSALYVDGDISSSGNLTIEGSASFNVVSASAKNFTVNYGTGTDMTASLTNPGDAYGEIIQLKGTHAAVTQGSVVYLSNTIWRPSDAASEIGTKNMLGVTMDGGGVGDARVLIKGFAKLNADIGFIHASASGAPVYLSTSLGQVDHGVPSGSGEFARIVGHHITGSADGAIIYFDPDKTWIEIA